MSFSRWRPFNPVWNQLQQLHGEVNRLFDRWSGDGGRQPGLAVTYPPVNIWEDAETLFVEAELPGLDLKDLEIYVTGGTQLTLKGERKPSVPEKGIWHRQERGCGPFARDLTLPFNVNSEHVEARFENGVLLVKLAKNELTRPHKIVVQGK